MLRKDESGAGTSLVEGSKTRNWQIYAGHHYFESTLIACAIDRTI